MKQGNRPQSPAMSRIGLSVNTEQSLRYYLRSMVRDMALWLGQEAVERAPSDRRLAVKLHTYDSEREKFRCWLVDAVATACEDLLAGELLYGYRGLLLAREYVGRCGGFAPSHVADALSVLQNALEEVLRPVDEAGWA